MIAKLAEIRLRLAEPKSRLLRCAEGVPFCGFRFMPGLRPRVLGATKRRFEKRKRRLMESKAGLAELGKSVFAWYQFSREGNSYGLRRCYAGGCVFVRFPLRNACQTSVAIEEEFFNRRKQRFLKGRR